MDSTMTLVLSSVTSISSNSMVYSCESKMGFGLSPPIGFPLWYCLLIMNQPQYIESPLGIIISMLVQVPPTSGIRSCYSSGLLYILLSQFSSYKYIFMKFIIMNLDLLNKYVMRLRQALLRLIYKKYFVIPLYWIQKVLQITSNNRFICEVHICSIWVSWW